MTPDEKKPFADIAKLDKIRFDTEIAEYESKIPIKPKPLRNAYLEFTKDVRSKVPTGQKITMNEIAVKWLKLTDDEKKPYQILQDADKVRHFAEFSRYQDQIRQLEKRYENVSSLKIYNGEKYVVVHGYAAQRVMKTLGRDAMDLF